MIEISRWSRINSLFLRISIFSCRSNRGLSEKFILHFGQDISLALQNYHKPSTKRKR
jgi:hypothetical protein